MDTRATEKTGTVAKGPPGIARDSTHIQMMLKRLG